MSTNVDRITAAADAIVEDAETVKTVVTDLKTLVADLTEKVNNNTLDQEALASAAQKLEDADASIDSVTNPVDESET